MCKRMNAKTFKVNEFLEIQHEILSTIDANKLFVLILPSIFASQYSTVLLWKSVTVAINYELSWFSDCVGHDSISKLLFSM